MRGDQLATDRNIKTPNLDYHRVSKKRSYNARVDINDLMSRVRQNEKKTKKRKFSFFWHSCFSNSYTGIIASL